MSTNSFPLQMFSAFNSSHKKFHNENTRAHLTNGLGCFHYHNPKGGLPLNPNADYLGIVTLLRGLRERGLVSGSEAKKIAARLMVQLGADIIISL